MDGMPHAQAICAMAPRHKRSANDAGEAAIRERGTRRGRVSEVKSVPGGAWAVPAARCTSGVPVEVRAFCEVTATGQVGRSLVFLPYTSPVCESSLTCLIVFVFMKNLTEY